MIRFWLYNLSWNVLQVVSFSACHIWRQIMPTSGVNSSHSGKVLPRSGLYNCFLFLPIWSFIPVYFSVYELLVCTHEFLFSNGLWVTTQLNYFGALLVPALVSGSPFSLALMSTWCFPHHFLFLWELFFTFWHNEVFQDHLVCTLSRPWNQPFLWGAQVLFSGKSVRHLKVHVFSDPLGCLSVGPILWKLAVAWLMNFGSSWNYGV